MCPKNNWCGNCTELIFKDGKQVCSMSNKEVYPQKECDIKNTKQETIPIQEL